MDEEGGRRRKEGEGRKGGKGGEGRGRKRKEKEGEEGEEGEEGKEGKEGKDGKDGKEGKETKGNERKRKETKGNERKRKETNATGNEPCTTQRNTSRANCMLDNPFGSGDMERMQPRNQPMLFGTRVLSSATRWAQFGLPTAVSQSSVHDLRCDRFTRTMTRPTNTSRNT